MFESSFSGKNVSSDTQLTCIHKSCPSVAIYLISDICMLIMHTCITYFSRFKLEKNTFHKI